MASRVKSIESNNPVWDKYTTSVIVAATAAGAAVDLAAAAQTELDVHTNLVKPGGLTGLLVCNGGINTAYIRTAKGHATAAAGTDGYAAAQTGEGIPVAPGERFFLPMVGTPDDPPGYECLNELTIVCFF